MSAFDPLRTLHDNPSFRGVSERTSISDEWRGGCFLALALFLAPLLVVAIWPDRLALSQEWPFLLLWGLQLALPFGYLALDGTKDWLSWSVAAFLTLACWGLLLKFGGAGLGAALISFAIPLFITATAWATNRHA
jgi:hypothetical protein